jgi:collagenase-like PrtC family protease
MTRILSPVTSFESAVDVIAAGANEIYCGVSIPDIQYMGLSTRYKWCSLSTYDELGRIARYARDHSVELIVTTELPFMTEMIENEVKNHILSCVEEGIDALIVTDLGILMMVKRMGLDIPVYASTYLASMNYEAVDFLKNLDVKRIILERHVTLPEIDDIVQRSKGVEVEIFIHGPGCSNINVSCYGCPSVFFVKDQSQLKKIQLTPCLATYEVYEAKGNKFNKIAEVPILDAYTYCSLCRLPELVKTGVTGFKIVGRCLTKSYQAETTKLYRDLLNLIDKNQIKSFWEKLNNIKNNVDGDSAYKVPFSCRQQRCYYSPLFHAPYKK